MPRAGAFVLAIVLSGPCVAAAQAPPDTAANDAEARARFQAGERAFARGDFEAALEDFERAYSLSRRPGLLYNVGLAAQRARRRERAIEAFREYLRLEPDTANRASVERTIADLEELLAAEGSGEPAEAGDETGAVAATGEPETSGGMSAGATPPTVLTNGEGDGPGAAPIVLLAAGGAVAIGGIVLLVAAGSAASDVEDAQAGTPWSEVESSYDSAGTLSTIGGIGLGVGVVAAAVGVVLLATSGGGSDEPSASLRVGPGTLALAGSFR